MGQQLKSRLFRYAIYLLLVAGITWQAFAIAGQFRPGMLFPKIKTNKVTIDGNVRRPGLYNVPEGSSVYEILKVAGVRPTSDLSSINLTGAAEDNQNLRVGTLDQPATITEENPTAQLEFYFGDVNIVKQNGTSVPVGPSTPLTTGDRIITETASQAEISLGSFSRIDIDNFSEILFDKIGAIENNKVTTDIFHRAGSGWYKIVYTGKNDIMHINTPFATLTIGGSGADFIIDVRSNEVVVNTMDGLVLAERTGTGDALNIIAGQSVIITNDNRPFQLSKLTPDISANEQFSQLAQEKTNYINRNMPLNFLFVGEPLVFYLVNVRFESGVINAIRLPPEMLIEQYVKGFTTFDQALLIGGPAFGSTLVEQVMGVRIPKYISFSKEDLIKFASATGGITVNVDAKAAVEIKVSPGTQNLTGDKFAKYLGSSISGVLDARKRQSEAMRALFQAFRNRNIVLTAMLSEQMLSNMNSNFTASEIMTQFNKFNARTTWSYKESDIPGVAIKRGNRICFDPSLDQARVLVSTK